MGSAAIGDGHRDICTLLAPPQLLEQYARKKLVQKRKKKRNKGKTDDIRPGTHSETIFLYVCWTAIKRIAFKQWVDICQYLTSSRLQHGLL
jgi:hypothetical protein